MTETTGPVAFDTPPEVEETPEQQRERLTKIREQLKAEREDREVQMAIVAGWICFFTWVRSPYKRFVILHPFPARKEVRQAQHRYKASKAATKALKAAKRKPKAITLQDKRRKNKESLNGSPVPLVSEDPPSA